MDFRLCSSSSTEISSNLANVSGSLLLFCGEFEHHKLLYCSIHLWQFRIFNHLVDTIMIHVWVLYWQVCDKKGASEMNQKAFRIDYAKSLCKLGLQSAHRQTMDFWHNWRSNKDIQSLLLPQGMFQLIEIVTGLYGRMREKHANSQTM
jgi:hypothetical protein